MKVYGSLISPFVRKVIVAATEKGMDHQLIGTSPGGSDPEFLEASPFGKIPALRDGDYCLADSSAIIAYMEARQPDPALIPAEAQARGKTVWYDEYADTILAASGLKILFNRLVGPRLLKLPYDEAVAVQGEAELPRLLDYLEGVVPAEGWLVGEFTLADISVASMLRSLRYVGQLPQADRYPGIVGWYNRVIARPAWQAVAEREDKTAAKLGLL